MISDTIRNIATDLCFQFRLRGSLMKRLGMVFAYYDWYQLYRMLGWSQAQARDKTLCILNRYNSLCRFRLLEGLEMEMDNVSAAFMTREHLLERTYDRFVMPKRGDVVVDVGAHQGLYALRAARVVGPTGIVYAIEPEEINFKILTQNVDRNDIRNVKVMNKALQHVNGKGKLYLSRTGTGNHSMVSSTDAMMLTEIDCITLDSIGLYRLDLLKIDVEGYYLRVLEGARTALLRYRPAIIMEVEDGDKGMANVRELLKPFGYRIQSHDRILYASVS